MEESPQFRPAAALLGRLDGYVERLRVRLPGLPEGLLSAYVRGAPWVAIVFGALGLLIPGWTYWLPLVLLGASAGAAAFSANFLGMAGSLLVAILEVVGGYLMVDRRLTGWWILAAGLVLNALEALATGSLTALVLILLLTYVHLQAKPRYG